MARLKPIERRFALFTSTPVSVRHAMGVIVTATVVSVIIGGILIRLFDPAEFPDLGTGLWWALQTVTTVGYGDVAPQNANGRIVGAVIMLESIAFVSIVTAAITSSFVERARRERMSADPDQSSPTQQLAARLDEITERLDRIERALDSREGDGPSLDSD